MNHNSYNYPGKPITMNHNNYNCPGEPITMNYNNYNSSRKPITMNHNSYNRVGQSRDFNFDSDSFSTLIPIRFQSWFRFRFHSWLASASRQSFTAVCKQVAKLPVWETQQGFANDCSSLNIARIYMKYKIFVMHSMTPRFSSPRMVQNKLWTSELRRWASELPQNQHFGQ